MTTDDKPTETLRAEFAPVTVVIPCYRNAKTIRRAVLSAFEQSWPPAEVIVIDDASHDQATDVALNELKIEFNRRRLTILEIKANCGPANARNIGWEAGNEQFVAFLDADDAWETRKLELQVPLMMTLDAPAISGHDIRVGEIQEFEMAVGPTRDVMHHITAQQLLFRNWYATSSVIVRATIPYRFDADRRFCEDYDLWLRIALSGSGCAFLPIPLARYFKSLFGASGLSGQLWKMEIAQASVYSKLRSEGLISFLEYVALTVWASGRFVRRLTVAMFRRLGAR